MFPFQQIDELVVDPNQDLLPANSSNPYYQLQNQIHQDLFMVDGGQAPLVTTPTNINFNDNNNYHYYDNRNNIHKIEDNNNPQIDSHMNMMKKIVNRDIERQRRQEMSTLQASLRSLLPLDFIKEKSSISEHMQQAENYIKHLQRNVDGLHARRDELMNLSGNSRFDAGNPEHDSRNCSIMINKLDGGLEILISLNVKENESLAFPLSIVLRALVEERANPVSCISTTENERFLWRIQCEASDEACVEIPDLQRRIYDLVITKFN